MKKFLFITTCLFFIHLQAQPYKSYFGKNYNKWYILYDGKVCPNTFNYLTCVNRTTIIEGKTYQLLFEMYETLHDTINSVPANTLSNQFLREDSVSGRLYYRYTISSDYGTSYSPEILVSDMGLHVGDSIPLNVTGNNLSHWSNLKRSINNKYYAVVDSVFFKSGLKHVRTSALFNSDDNNMFENPKTALTFIEGVGSNLSPVLDYYHLAYMSDIWKLMCNINDSTTTHYSISGECRTYHTCDGGIDGLIDTKNINRFKLSISLNSIQINFDLPFSGNIRLIQSNGIMIYASPVSKELDHSINVQHLQSGIYILQIINKEEVITTTKIIL